MSFSKLGAEIWRDFVTTGVPGSGAWDVVKADMRAWMASVEADIGGANTYIAAGWQTATSYSLGDIVWHGSVDYVCILAHTSGASTEPGTGADWEDVWEVFPSTKHPSGSASAPGIAFGADTDTGFFRLSANVIGVAAGGVAAAYFSAAGAIIPQGKSLAFQDSDASHNLLVQFGSNLSANRILSLLTGDNARTIDISAADLTLSAFGASLIDDAAASNARTTLGSTTVGDAVFIAANAAAARTAIGTVIGTDVQAYDAELAAIAGLTSAADKLPYFTGSGTAALADFTTFGRSLADDADASTARTTLGLVIGTHVQAYDALLASIAGLTFGADSYIYGTGSDTAAAGTITTQGRQLVDDTSFSAMRTTMGVAIGTDVQAWDVLLDSLAALSDPNADRIAFWDDSAGALQWLSLAGGASIDTTTLRIHESLVIAVSDETTALTAGTIKVTFRMPYAFTLTAVRASLSTAQTGNGGGGIFTVDINEGGTTILSTKLTIDNGEKTSTTAATPPVISDASLADDAEITIDIDQIGDGTAAGLKVYLIGYRP